MDRLTVSATANGLNYLPEYYASATGLFARAGLDIVSTAKDPWTGVLDDLASGAADLALGGLWVPAMYVGTRRELSVVAQLNHQFPMAILTREAVEDFDLSWLKGRTALAPGAGGSAPYEFTAGLIREAGLDPHATRWVRDLSTAMLVELYVDGLGDAIVADLVTATELENAGHGRIAFRHLDGGGTMPNSVYYCRTDRLAELSEPVTRFRGAVQQAMDELPQASAGVIDQILADRWPDKDHAVLTGAVEQMLASEVWRTTVVDEAASDRWMRILAEGGLVTSPPSYSALMNTGAGLPVTLFLSRADLDGLLTTTEVIRAVEEIHLDLGLGTMIQTPPAALASSVSDAVLLPMTALSDRLGLAVVKLLSDIPGNRERGLPPQRSTLLVTSTVTGECLAVLDGAVITRQRTAAASAVATAHLARSDSRTLGLVGAGALAVEHVRALTAVRPFEAVVVWTRSEQTLLAFALECDRLGLDLPITHAASPQDVVAQSDVVCTLTPSRTPIVEGRWFRPGQHINAVGAPPRPTHREIDAEGIGRSELFVDSASTSLAKSGEVLLAIADGVLPADSVLRELGAVVAQLDPGRVDPDAITLFNSVGIGAQDLAVAALALDRARRAGLGTDLPMTGTQLQGAT